MTRLILTSEEAAILNVLEQDSQASIPEIAVATKLTPSKVRDAIARLRDKEYIRISDTNLLDKGRKSRSFIYKIYFKRDQQLSRKTVANRQNHAQIVRLTNLGKRVQRSIRSKYDSVFITDVAETTS